MTITPKNPCEVAVHVVAGGLEPAVNSLLHARVVRRLLFGQREDRLRRLGDCRPVTPEVADSRPVAPVTRVSFSPRRGSLEQSSHPGEAPGDRSRAPASATARGDVRIDDRSDPEEERGGARTCRRNAPAGWPEPGERRDEDDCERHGGGRRSDGRYVGVRILGRQVRPSVRSGFPCVGERRHDRQDSEAEQRSPSVALGAEGRLAAPDAARQRRAAAQARRPHPRSRWPSRRRPPHRPAPPPRARSAEAVRSCAPARGSASQTQARSAPRRPLHRRDCPPRGSTRTRRVAGRSRDRPRQATEARTRTRRTRH